MALNLYGKTNYEIEVPLTFNYSRKAIVMPVSTQSTFKVQYMYTRHATKTYSFKGMTEAALQACLNEKQLLYTRRFMQWTFYAQYWRSPFEIHMSQQYYLEPPPYTDQVASFNVTRTSDAPVFDLQIDVNETTILYDTEDYMPNALSGVQHIEQLFTTQTTYTGSIPLWDDYRSVPYYKSYAYEYTYDENLSGDTIISGV